MNSPAGSPAEPSPAGSPASSALPRPGGAVPRAIVVAAIVWAVNAVVLVLTWFGLGDTGGGEDESVGRIRDTLGPSAVAGGDGNGLLMLRPVVAVVLVLLVLVLFLRQGWVLWALTLAGLAGVLLLASGGRWETLLSMVLVVVGAVALMTSGARRWFAP